MGSTYCSLENVSMKPVVNEQYQICLLVYLLQFCSQMVNFQGLYAKVEITERYCPSLMANLKQVPQTRRIQISSQSCGSNLEVQLVQQTTLHLFNVMFFRSYRCTTFGRFHLFVRCFTSIKNLMHFSRKNLQKFI